MQVSGKPAVRYTAVLGGLKKSVDCSPTKMQVDIVATPGYSNAEVALFVVKHNVSPESPVTDQVVDRIVGSLTKS